MGKKEKMLDYIMDNIQWLLATEASEVVPYYNMSEEVFYRAKEYLAEGWIDPEEVVCLVSTSIFRPWKSGIVFTTDCIFCKPWGAYNKHMCFYWAYECADFGLVNGDFHEDRMKILMKGLEEISEEEDEQLQQKSNEIADVGKKVGLSLLGVMAVIDVFSLIGDNKVKQNNERITREISGVTNDQKQERIDATEIYEKFEMLIYEFVNAYGAYEKLEQCEDAEREAEICDLYVHSIMDVLLQLWRQVLDNENISPEQSEEHYKKYVDWQNFWALLFYDDEQFNKTYVMYDATNNSDQLEGMPAVWRVILVTMDALLENEWEDTFSDVVIYDFAETIVGNGKEMQELMSDVSFDELDEFGEKIEDIVNSNNQAVVRLGENLGRATDFLADLLDR